MARAKRDTALGTAASYIERLGLVDIFVPAIRTRLERIDPDELLDEITDYVRRTPEILVVVLGSLTVTTGLIVYLMRRAEEEERREQQAQRTAAKRRTSARRKD